MLKPIILVTNDDGITAPGIRRLVEIARTLGDVLVVAPDKPQSAQGHAITINAPLRLKEVAVFSDLDGVQAYECTGTPVDCVKLAKNILLKDRPVALCVSGINHGSNASVNILYSGTMSAAMEAAIEGIPSIGFSLLNYKWDANFVPGSPYIRQLMQYVLDNGLPTNRLLNVNIPDLPADQLKGLRLCRQAKGHWTENFLVNKDPQGNPYYWLMGNFICTDNADDTDVWALQHGYLSVVPSMYDLTDYPAVEALRTQIEAL